MNARRTQHRHTSRRRRHANDLPTTITLSPPNSDTASNGSSCRLSSLLSPQRRTSALLLFFGLAALHQFQVSFLPPLFSNNNTNGDRRSLLSTMYLSAHSTLMPWAHHNLVDITHTPNTDLETALFWHIPKSGGTTAKRLYQCMGRTLAHRVGADPRFGHDQDREIAVFEPHGGKDWKVVNVDTTIRSGIVKAGRMGLVERGVADLVR